VLYLSESSKTLSSKFLVAIVFKLTIFVSRADISVKRLSLLVLAKELGIHKK